MNIATSPHENANCIPEQAWPNLDQVTSPTVTTNAAAYYLNRRPQTLRAWASLEEGPIRPVRVNGRLAWSVQEIKNLLNI